MNASEDFAAIVQTETVFADKFSFLVLESLQTIYMS